MAWLFECNQPGLKTNGLQTSELSSSFRNKFGRVAWWVLQEWPLHPLPVSPSLCVERLSWALAGFQMKSLHSQMRDE